MSGNLFLVGGIPPDENIGPEAVSDDDANTANVVSFEEHKEDLRRARAAAIPRIRELIPICWVWKGDILSIEFAAPDEDIDINDLADPADKRGGAFRWVANVIGRFFWTVLGFVSAEFTGETIVANFRVAEWAGRRIKPGERRIALTSEEFASEFATADINSLADSEIKWEETSLCLTRKEAGPDGLKLEYFFKNV